jgi:ankyrin repeat protein
VGKKKIKVKKLAVKSIEGGLKTYLEMLSQEGFASFGVVDYIQKYKGLLQAYRDEDGENFLHIVARHPNIHNYSEVIRALLDIGLSPSSMDNLNQTPIHILAESYNIGYLRAMVESLGVHERIRVVNMQDKSGDTALHVAVKVHLSDDNGLLTMEQPLDLEKKRIFLSELLEYGARPDVVNIYGDSPLHIATSSDNVDAAIILLQNNASVTILNYDLELPIDRLVLDKVEENSNLLAMIDILCKYDSPLNNVPNSKSNIVSRIIKSNKAEALAEIISFQSAKLDIQDKVFQEWYKAACIWKSTLQPGYFEYVVPYPNVYNQMNGLRLLYAINSDADESEILELLELGANPMISFKGVTAFDIMLEKSFSMRNILNATFRLGLVDVLNDYDHPFSVDLGTVVSSYGERKHMFFDIRLSEAISAILSLDQELEESLYFSALLENIKLDIEGINISYVDKIVGKFGVKILDTMIYNGMSVMHQAAFASNILYLKKFQDYGLSIDKIDIRGATSLHAVCFVAHNTIIKYLISRGAEVNASFILNAHSYDALEVLAYIFPFFGRKDFYIDSVKCILESQMPSDISKTMMFKIIKDDTIQKLLLQIELLKCVMSNNYIDLAFLLGKFVALGKKEWGGVDFDLYGTSLLDEVLKIDYRTNDGSKYHLLFTLLKFNPKISTEHLIKAYVDEDYPILLLLLQYYNGDIRHFTREVFSKEIFIEDKSKCEGEKLLINSKFFIEDFSGILDVAIDMGYDFIIYLMSKEIAVCKVKGALGKVLQYAISRNLVNIVSIAKIHMKDLDNGTIKSLIAPGVSYDILSFFFDDLKQILEHSIPCPMLAKLVVTCSDDTKITYGKEKNTLLHYFTKYFDSRVLEFLLKTVDIDSPNSKGATAAHIACRIENHDKIEPVLFWIRHGANFVQEDHSRNTPVGDLVKNQSYVFSVILKSINSGVVVSSEQASEFLKLCKTLEMEIEIIDPMMRFIRLDHVNKKLLGDFIESVIFEFREDVTEWFLDKYGKEVFGSNFCNMLLRGYLKLWHDIAEYLPEESDQCKSIEFLSDDDSALGTTPPKSTFLGLCAQRKAIESSDLDFG